MNDLDFSVKAIAAGILLIAAGGALAIALPRLAGFDRRIGHAVLGCYAVRVLMAVIVFGVALADLDMFRQQSNPAGVWWTFPDAVANHTYALDMVRGAVR